MRRGKPGWQLCLLRVLEDGGSRNLEFWIAEWRRFRIFKHLGLAICVLYVGRVLSLSLLVALPPLQWLSLQHKHPASPAGSFFCGSALSRPGPHATLQSMLTLRGDHPQALALRQQIEAGRVEELSETLAHNPALARAVVLDAKGHGRSLLHIATDWPGHFPNVARTIATLATAGADLNAAFLPAEGETLHRETPLHWAASSNDLAAIDALLTAGADIEAPGAVFTGGTAMSDAVIFAQWDAARLLLARGAQTTFTQAAALGLMERVTRLLAEDRPSAETITAALWHACRAGQHEAAEFLLRQGAELNWIGWDHLTPLDAAQKNSHTELAAWLLAQGAKSARELAV